MPASKGLKSRQETDGRLIEIEAKSSKITTSTKKEKNRMNTTRATRFREGPRKPPRRGQPSRGMRNERMPAKGKAGGKASQVGGTARAKALMQDQASGNIVAHS